MLLMCFFSFIKWLRGSWSLQCFVVATRNSRRGMKMGEGDQGKEAPSPWDP